MVQPHAAEAAEAGGVAPAKQGCQQSYGKMACRWHHITRELNLQALSELGTFQQVIQKMNQSRRTAAFSGGGLDPNTEPDDSERFHKDLLCNALDNIASTLYTNTAPPRGHAAERYHSEALKEDESGRQRYTFSVFCRPPVLVKDSAHAKRTLPNNNKRRQRKLSRNTVIGATHILFRGTGTVPSPCLVVSPARVKKSASMSLNSEGYLRVDLLKRSRIPQNGKVVKLGTVVEYAHRLVLIATKGWPAARRKLVRPVACHLCHNPRCLNPLHLAWGEHADNVMNEWSLYGRTHPQHFTKLDREGNPATAQGHQGTTVKRRDCFRPTAHFKALTRACRNTLKQRELTRERRKTLKQRKLAQERLKTLKQRELKRRALQATQGRRRRRATGQNC